MGKLDIHMQENEYGHATSCYTQNLTQNDQRPNVRRKTLRRIHR